MAGFLRQTILPPSITEILSQNRILSILLLSDESSYMILEEEDGSVRQEGYTYLDHCLEWCRKYHLHMIIDLHETFGYSFDPLDKTDKTVFFHDAIRQERFYSLWKTIASRYGGYPDSIAFELLNEIVEPSVAEDWNRIALKTIREIRAIAPDSWIIFGGTRYNSVLSVPELPDLEDEKVAYTFHSYEPIIFTHQGAYWVDNMRADFRIRYPESIVEYRTQSRRLSLQLAGVIYREDLTEMTSRFFETLFLPALKIAEERNIPLYCGEYGVIDLADDSSKINWTADICSIFDKYQIGRAYWNYKEKDFGIINIQDEKIRKQLAEKL